MTLLNSSNPSTTEMPSTTTLDTNTSLHQLYRWIDSIPLNSISKKTTLARDFSDAVCVAEIIHAYQPSWVELHNYPKTSNSSQKAENWRTLQTKVLRKRFHQSLWLREDMIQKLVDTRQPERVLDVLEPFLENLRIALLDDTATAENHDTSLRQEIENSEKNTWNTSNDREEVRRLRELVRVLEQQVAKQESMIRLQQSKIDALVAMIDDDTTGGSHGVVK